MAAKQIFLCRHGQTEWNLEKRIQGQLDSPLTSDGKKQARDLALKAKHWNIQLVLSSTLGRAKTTAEICACYLGVPAFELEGVEERHFGQWQGFQGSTEEINDFKLVRYQQKEIKPGESGESTTELLTRAAASLKSLVQYPQQKILLISHGDLIASVISNWQVPQRVANCGGALLELENEQLSMVGLL